MKLLLLSAVTFCIVSVVYGQKKQLLYATLASGFETKTYWEIKNKPFCLKLHLDTVDSKIWNVEPNSKQFYYPKYPMIPMRFENLFDVGKHKLTDFEIELIVITVMLRGVYEPILIQTKGCVNDFFEFLKPIEDDQAEESLDGKLFVKVFVKYKQSIRIELNEIFIPMPFNNK